MKRILTFLISAAVLLGADVTGTWRFQVETDMGSGTPTITLKQDGDKLTGNYKGQLGEAPVTGKIEGSKLQFSFEVSPAGDKMAVTYSGVTKGENKMSGTVDFAGQGKGTFTATKE